MWNTNILSRENIHKVPLEPQLSRKANGQTINTCDTVEKIPSRQFTLDRKLFEIDLKNDNRFIYKFCKSSTFVKNEHKLHLFSSHFTDIKSAYLEQLTNYPQILTSAHVSERQLLSVDEFFSDKTEL